MTRSHFSISGFLISLVSVVLFLPNAVWADSSINSYSNSMPAIALDRVWSGHPVGFTLLTRGKHQFVAYYDANRQMTVANRVLGAPWRYYKVDSWVGWDSHNYVTVELDSEGHLHVMGNMHAAKLEYFRTTKPYDIRSLKRVNKLVDLSLEQRMTYPVFLIDKKGQLIVKYRDGGSGNGNEIYNVYDVKKRAWSRLHDNQFLDGEGKMNAYFSGPTLGPDGYFHLIWVWRNTPDASTNHSLSYARSSDLIDWQTSAGTPLRLPLKLNETEVVDPVPVKGGMINGNVKLGFDQQKRPVIAYHKYDESGNTQIYVSRKEKTHWRSVQISDWDGYRWDFGGGGSLGKFELKPHSPAIIDKDKLGVVVRREESVMQFVLDTKTLKTLKVETTELYPPIINERTQAVNKGLLERAEHKSQMKVVPGKGDQSPTGKYYYLSWHTQPANRDKAASTIPQPSLLLLHELTR